MQQHSPTDFEDRRVDQLQGVGADTLLRVLGPVIKQQSDALLLKLIQCEPTLEKLLEIRGELAAFFRITKELEQLSSKGKEASEVLAKIFS
jgi:hypothetical protein